MSRIGSLLNIIQTNTPKYCYLTCKTTTKSYDWLTKVANMNAAWRSFLVLPMLPSNPGLHHGFVWALSSLVSNWKWKSSLLTLGSHSTSVLYKLLHSQKNIPDEKNFSFSPIICPLEWKNCVYKYIMMCARQFKCCLLLTALFIVKGNLKAPSPGHKTQPYDVFSDFSFPL